MNADGAGPTEDATAFGIDEVILAAFERGTRMHVRGVPKLCFDNIEFTCINAVGSQLNGAVDE